MTQRERREPMIEVRHSPVHGYGVFALRRIRKGTTVIEYLGDRLSHDEADTRYEDKLETDNHTFLFTVDAKIVIDAGCNGNEARFINHGCDPNCESVVERKRVFINAIRTIQPGDELAYDYQIQRDDDDAPNVDEIFACRCGAKNCRGSMLEPRKKIRVRKKKPGRKEQPGRKKPGRKKPGRNSRAGGKAPGRNSRAGGKAPGRKTAPRRRKAGPRARQADRAGARRKTRRRGA